MQNFVAIINIDKTKALKNGLSNYGQTEIPFDPGQLTPEERELLSKANWKDGKIDLTYYSKNILLERGLQAIRLCIEEIDKEEKRQQELELKMQKREDDDFITHTIRWLEDEGRYWTLPSYSKAGEDAKDKGSKIISEWLESELNKNPPSFNANMPERMKKAYEFLAGITKHENQELYKRIFKFNEDLEKFNEERQRIREEQRQKLLSAEKELIEEFIAKHASSETALERFNAGVLPDNELKEMLRKAWFAPLSEFAKYKKITAEEVEKAADEDSATYSEIEFHSNPTKELEENEYLIVKRINEILDTVELPFNPCHSCEITYHAGGYEKSQAWEVARKSIKVEFWLQSDLYPSLDGIKVNARFALN